MLLLEFEAVLFTFRLKAPSFAPLFQSPAHLQTLFKGEESPLKSLSNRRIRKRAADVAAGIRSRVAHIQVEGSIARPIVPVTGSIREINAG
jgi:hypothetical protein